MPPISPSISNPAMVAETAAYAGGEEWLNQCVDYIDGNLDYAHDYITKNLPLIKTGNKPEGTYLMWLDVTGSPTRSAPRRRWTRPMPSRNR